MLKIKQIYDINKWGKNTKFGFHLTYEDVINGSVWKCFPIILYNVVIQQRIRYR